MMSDQIFPDEPALKDFKITFWNLPQWLLLSMIRLYQKTISRALPGNTCRFYPSCSHYGYQAIYKYGFVRGLFKTIRRVLRCNPFNPGGYDPLV